MRSMKRFSTEFWSGVLLSVLLFGGMGLAIADHEQDPTTAPVFTGFVNIKGEVYHSFKYKEERYVCWKAEEYGYVDCLTESEQELTCEWLPMEQGWFHNCGPRKVHGQQVQI